MKSKRTLALVCLSALAVTAASVAVIAQPAGGPTTRSNRPRTVRLTTPWNKVPDLTDEQKGKINTIHEETVDKVKALEAAEDEQCWAILTADQKLALQDLLDKEAAEKKKAKAEKEKK